MLEYKIAILQPNLNQKQIPSYSKTAQIITLLSLERESKMKIEKRSKHKLMPNYNYELSVPKLQK